MLAFRHLPAERMHPGARRAAEMAGCADRLGGFWRVHDTFFAKPITQESELESRAMIAGLTRQALDECRREGLALRQIEQDAALAKYLRIEGTPVALLGRLKHDQIDVSSILVGARPLVEFEAAIDRLLGEGAAK